MKDKVECLKKYISVHRKELWYMFCFACLGLIDQRKQSAPGEIQMIFGNSTSYVVAALLLPSIDLYKFRQKLYIVWTPICVGLVAYACAWGKSHMIYKGAWVSTVCGMAIWSYLLLYIVREWNLLEGKRRIRQPFFWCIFLLLLSMMLSENKDNIPYWYLIMYGGFYLIGIRKEERNAFWEGMLNGIILWFFVQQTIAFGFRPYDEVRYKGMYPWVTFNSLFYLIAYCATSLRWLLAKDRKCRWEVRFFWFFLSAGCVGLMFITGGRSVWIGVCLATIVLYGWYDIIKKTSFYKILLHFVSWVLCVIIAFPMVYGCVRYFPTILHHPIWFAGEYKERISVCSYDSWDSEKYVTFEEACEVNGGRLLDLLGITFKEEDPISMLNPFVMHVYAADKVMSEETKERVLEKIGLENYVGGINSRKLLYASCLVQLNWKGHESGEIPTADGNIYSHAHNMFLDMAYRHGILAGALYLGVCVYSVLQTLWRRKPENIILVVFMLGLLSFGMFEQLAMMGQFGVALIWILFYFAGEDSKMLFDKKHA